MNDDQHRHGHLVHRVIAAAALLGATLPLAAQPVTHLSGGKVRYVEVPLPAPGAVLASRALTESGLRVAVASALQTYAGQFGVSDASRELELVSSEALGSGDSVWRHRQVHSGLPIIGAELVAVLDGAGFLHTLSGEIFENPSVATLVPSIGTSAASATALELTAKHHSIPVTQLVASIPELALYQPSLLGLDTEAQTALVWRIEVTPIAPAPIRQLVLVDAATGAVALTFNQAETARNRLTYSSGNTSVIPGTLLCNESQPNCTNGANADADAAHRYAGQMYDFYFTNHERDSFNDRGATLTSSVNHVYSGCPNAFWNGAQMVYCAGAAQADDVVGHELTHAVTQATSNLVYYYQAGAINESLSDVWGELLDLTNGSGNDTAQVRWLMGEDWPGLGAVRNMANPAQLGSPDRMRSTLYWTSASDNGGVHFNSGVNNKAAYLLVDGGQFNGYTVTPIGLLKTAALYYRVQTQHLTSGSDYADLSVALTQACQNLIGGTAGITAGDCAQVANAVLAVEMQLEPTAFQNLDAAACPVGQSAQDVFFDDFEVLPSSRWQSVALTGTSPWVFVTGFATSERFSYFNQGSTAASDVAGTMAAQAVVPANGRLHFRHVFEFEASTSSTPVFYDGGVVEYSTDNGVTWRDLGALHEAGIDYSGTLDTAAGNPLGGREAFVARSGGYAASRYDLSSLAGQSIRIRFRSATDVGTRLNGWDIDDVRIYSCVTGAPANRPPVANAGTDQTRLALSTVTLDGAASVDPDGTIAAAQWLQTGGPTVTLSNGGSGLTVTFVAPTTPAVDILTFRLAIRDNAGATAFDVVRVTVATGNLPPVANAGADQAVRPLATVNLTGSGTDTDGTIAAFSWTQVGGPAVQLLNAATATPSFTAPSVTGTTRAILRLTVTDNLGGTDTDDVAVTITNASPVANAGTDRTVRPRETVSITGTATDTDGTIATYAWSQVSGPAVSLSGASTATVGFTAPSVAVQQVVTLRLTATDNEGGVGVDDVLVTVSNAQPVVNAGVDRTFRTRQPITVAGTATDPDGSIVSYSWTQVSGPAVQLANAATATVGFTTPSVLTQQFMQLRLTATDNDGASVSDDVFIWSFNDQPLVNAGPDVSVEPGASVTLTATATDINGTIASYAWQQTGGPAMTLTGANTRTAQFVAPTATTASVLTFRVTVTDQDNATAADTVVVTALGINLPPTANAGADQTLKPRTAVTLTGVGADADGTVASYAWTQRSGPTAQITGANTATPRVTLPAIATSATIVLRLTVTDNRGATATDEISLSASNVAPTVDAGADLSRAAGATVTITAAGDDPDGAIASYRWEHIGGPGVALVGATSQSVTFTAPSLTTASQVTLRVTATDADGATATDSVIISVDAQVVPPTQQSTSGGGGGGGGGVTGIAWLVALLGALAWRRRRLPGLVS